MKIPCLTDCRKDDPAHICQDCESCLIAGGVEQLPGDMYPLFKCLQCGNVVFWD